MAAEKVNIKKRSENFSAEETLFLVELVERNLEVLRSKQTNQITNAKKATVWREITEAVNARGSGSVRSVDQIKEKYRKACSKAKGEKSAMKTNLMKTGGGPPPKPIDPVSQKILDIHHDSPNFIGITGGAEVGGFIIQEVPAMTKEDESLGFNHLPENTDTGVEIAGQCALTGTILELPENVPEGATLTYDIPSSSSETCITTWNSKTKETGKTKKRKSEESLQDLQKSVLREDRERIVLQKELIQLQKEKVTLEIRKLQMELSGKLHENEI